MSSAKKWAGALAPVHFFSFLCFLGCVAQDEGGAWQRHLPNFAHSEGSAGVFDADFSSFCILKRR